ncbi:MAG: pyridoxamine 5'-phosphate oxidase family protein [Paracoccus sp. (in: a-proteobacteria)]|nr:pyridoxamine 5'-phosphate oxidase family protein [Paracoccus sp. (in: a-proteobacteria)]
MSDDRKEEFYKRLGDTRTGMLEAEGRFLPMSPNMIEDDPNIWFITADGTPMADAAAKTAPAKFIVSNDDKGLYADIDGTLHLSEDKEKLDEVWGLIASSWFEDGKRDEDVQLVRFAPKKAEIWMTEGGAFKFFYQVARAQVTGKKPDMGEHFSLTLG